MGRRKWNVKVLDVVNDKIVFHESFLKLFEQDKNKFKSILERTHKTNRTYKFYSIEEKICIKSLLNLYSEKLKCLKFYYKVGQSFIGLSRVDFVEKLNDRFIFVYKQIKNYTCSFDFANSHFVCGREYHEYW